MKYPINTFFVYCATLGFPEGSGQVVHRAQVLPFWGWGPAGANARLVPTLRENLKWCSINIAIAVFLLAIPTKKICAQPGILIKTKQENKNRVYAYWGWNRGYFTDSDIHFSGNGYDFTLKGVVAKDRQSEFSFATYFGPTKFTIPQVNYGIGYYLKNNCILTLGLDHMKYVVQRPQEVTISGNIDGSNLPYRGTYKGEHITLKDNLLKLEHTNGLNYLSAGIMRTDNLFKNIKTLKNKLELNLMEGIGAGALIPKTDVTLLSQPRNDQYHLSGFGLSANVGLQIVSFKHFFIRGELKTGYINLTSFVASPESGGKGSQHFFFLQPSGQFGWAFYLKRR